MMVTNAKILQLSRRIAEQFDPEQIILFGSRARGRPRRDSDVDLLVVMRFRGLSARKAAEILNRIEPAYAVETRYPGKSADRGLAREAVMLCAEIRTAVRGALRISK